MSNTSSLGFHYWNSSSYSIYTYYTLRYIVYTHIWLHTDKLLYKFHHKTGLNHSLKNLKNTEINLSYILFIFIKQSGHSLKYSTLTHKYLENDKISSIKHTIECVCGVSEKKLERIVLVSIYIICVKRLAGGCWCFVLVSCLPGLDNVVVSLILYRYYS